MCVCVHKKLHPLKAKSNSSVPSAEPVYIVGKSIERIISIQGDRSNFGMGGGGVT